MHTRRRPQIHLRSPEGGFAQLLSASHGAGRIDYVAGRPALVELLAPRAPIIRSYIAPTFVHLMSAVAMRRARGVATKLRPRRGAPQSDATQHTRPSTPVSSSSLVDGGCSSTPRGRRCSGTCGIPAQPRRQQPPRQGPLGHDSTRLGRQRHGASPQAPAELGGQVRRHLSAAGGEEGAQRWR